MNKPKVSVILSSYNHADFIGESIESILNQTFEDFELIIVDDCSSDNSWEIIKSYKDPRIKAIRNKKNVGMVVRPELFDTVEGEYFAMAHCDDVWEKTKLEKQVKFLDDNPGYAACFTLVRPIDDDGEDLADEKHAYYAIFDQKNRTRLEWLRQFFYDGNVLCHPSMMMRVDAQKEYNLYAYGCAALPDEYRWIRLCLHKNIYILQEKLTLFRVHSNESNTSGNRIDNLLRVNFERFALLDCYSEVLNYSEDDFLSVFPTGKKFRKKNIKNNLKYLFARLTIDKDNDSMYNLYGLKILWNMLSNESERKEIEQKYGFGHKDFVELTGQIDLLHIQDFQNTLTSVLHYDVGDGFKPELSLCKNVFVNNRHRFFVEYDLSGIRNICNLRFDPTHGEYGCFANLKILVDGRQVDFKPIDAVVEDGLIKFNTSNPNILIANCSCNKKLQISGEFYKRDYSEIDALLKDTRKRRFFWR